MAWRGTGSPADGDDGMICERMLFVDAQLNRKVQRECSKSANVVVNGD